MTQASTRKPQWWLVEIGIHGLPTLADGPHSGRAGCNRAAYLIKAMHLGNPDRKFEVARIQFEECVPESRGTNAAAIDTINAMREALNERRAKQG